MSLEYIRTRAADSPLGELVARLHPINMDGRVRYFLREWLERFLGSDLGELDAATVAQYFPASELYSDVDIVHTMYEQWLVEQGKGYRLYSATVDYHATGEGRTMHLVMGRSTSKAEFLAWVAPKIGDFFSLGIEIFEGAPPETNPVALWLLTDQMRSNIQVHSGRIDAHFHFHHNLS